MPRRGLSGRGESVTRPCTLGRSHLRNLRDLSPVASAKEDLRLPSGRPVRQEPCPPQPCGGFRDAEAKEDLLHRFPPLLSPLSLEGRPRQSVRQELVYPEWNRRAPARCRAGVPTPAGRFPPCPACWAGAEAPAIWTAALQCRFLSARRAPPCTPPGWGAGVAHSSDLARVGGGVRCPEGPAPRHWKPHPMPHD